MEIHGGLQCYKIAVITTLSGIETNVAIEMSKPVKLSNILLECV